MQGNTTKHIIEYSFCKCSPLISPTLKLLEVFIWPKVCNFLMLSFEARIFSGTWGQLKENVQKTLLKGWTTQGTETKNATPPLASQNVNKRKISLHGQLLTLADSWLLSLIDDVLINLVWNCLAETNPLSSVFVRANQILFNLMRFGTFFYLIEICQLIFSSHVLAVS